jgi:hypothetical protein
MAVNGFPRRSLLVSVSVTCRFDDGDAEAIAYELRGVLEQPATRANLRSFMRNAIRRAVAEARDRLEKRSFGEESPSFGREGERR